MSKVYSDPTAALEGLLHDNMTIAAGGFGLCGIPDALQDYFKPRKRPDVCTPGRSSLSR
jgi:acyl CoA:acetate/3-ketoacid CoA transferase alpha subunit